MEARLYFIVQFFNYFLLFTFVFHWNTQCVSCSFNKNVKHFSFHVKYLHAMLKKKNINWALCTLAFAGQQSFSLSLLSHYTDVWNKHLHMSATCWQSCVCILVCWHVIKKKHDRTHMTLLHSTNSTVNFKAEILVNIVSVRK